MIPQVNARLVKIERTLGTTAGGFSEDYDRPATDPESAGGEGKDEWAGSADAYFIAKRQRVGGDLRNLVLTRTLIVRPDQPEWDWQEGDRATWIFDGAQDSGKALVAEPHSLPGLPPIIRLTLEDVPG